MVGIPCLIRLRCLDGLAFGKFFSGLSEIQNNSVTL